MALFSREMLLKKYYAMMLYHGHPDLLKKAGVSKPQLKSLRKAVRHNEKNDDKKNFHLTYKKLNGQVVKRKVTPLEIRNRLLLGYDHRRKDIRAYKLERIAKMKKVAFWNGFEKQANVWHHAAEVGGLGVLAKPTIDEMRGKKVSEKSKHVHELAGLGILAAPAAHEIGKHLMHGK